MGSGWFCEEPSPRLPRETQGKRRAHEGCLRCSPHELHLTQVGTISKHTRQIPLFCPPPLALCFAPLSQQGLPRNSHLSSALVRPAEKALFGPPAAAAAPSALLSRGSEYSMYRRPAKAARTESTLGQHPSSDAPTAGVHHPRAASDPHHDQHAAASMAAAADTHPTWSIPSTFKSWEVDHTRFQFKRMLGKGACASAMSWQCLSCPAAT